MVFLNVLNETHPSGLKIKVLASTLQFSVMVGQTDLVHFLRHQGKISELSTLSYE